MPKKKKRKIASSKALVLSQTSPSGTIHFYSNSFYKGQYVLIIQN